MVVVAVGPSENVFAAQDVQAEAEVEAAAEVLPAAQQEHAITLLFVISDTARATTVE